MDQVAGRHRIVVGVDGSAGAGYAIEWAVRETELRRASLELVHAWTFPYFVSPMGVPAGYWDTASSETAAKEVLERQAEAHGLDTRIDRDRLTTICVGGGAAAALLARAEDADLLVVGSRGRGGFSGLVLGSVSLQCLHHAPCPVTVVRDPRPAEVRRVLVGVDGSDRSAVALAWAADEAGRRGATLVVAHAWIAPYPSVPFGPTVTPRDLVRIADGCGAMVDEMTDVAVAAADHQPPAVEKRVMENTPRAALMELAEDADLLVIGSRGRGGFAGLLLGSVSQYCVHHAPCAVTVVPTARDRQES